MALRRDIHAKKFTVLQLFLIVAVGVLAYFSSYVVTAVWVFVLMATVFGSATKKPEWIWYGIAASPGLEVWSRITRAPVVVDEIGKYYLLLAIPALLFYHVRVRSHSELFRAGQYLLFFLLPSLIVNIADFDREQWVFNILSLLELSLLLMLIARERWNVERFAKTIHYATIPIIWVTIYLGFTSPFIGGMSFSLGGNFEATAGWGTNQVATILGLGVLLLVLQLMLKRPAFAKWICYILITYMLFRSFLTFSRGGVISAVSAVLIAMFYAMIASRKTFVRYSFILFSVALLGGVVFVEVNDLAENKLVQRYLGETPATLSGDAEKTWKKITSGRSVLIETEWEIFNDYPIFGAGPGGAKKLRAKYGGPPKAAAHTEYTRLLSEHGIGGGVAAAILFIFPIYWMRRQRFKLWKGIAGALFCMALLTAAHSAMRTNTTVVCYALAAVPVFMAISKSGRKIGKEA